MLHRAQAGLGLLIPRPSSLLSVEITGMRVSSALISIPLNHRTRNKGPEGSFPTMKWAGYEPPCKGEVSRCHSEVEEEVSSEFAVSQRKSRVLGQKVYVIDSGDRKICGKSGDGWIGKHTRLEIT